MAEKRAAAEARLLADVEALMALPQPRVDRRKRPGLRIRLRMEVVWPGGREGHAVTLHWCPVFRRWSVPQRQVLKGLAALMQHAPEIAGV